MTKKTKKLLEDLNSEITNLRSRIESVENKVGLKTNIGLYDFWGMNFNTLKSNTILQRLEILEKAATINKKIFDELTDKLGFKWEEEKTETKEGHWEKINNKK